ncbi:GreA/GreB family elongation factor [Peptoniphilus duerdenii]|uniref:GreA/GreB family elongation factor n=1 Tax=Peptoniphilus duerdenii TaxID=507750 RepID=UPI00288B745C|nr:GreA/GreB family elongation factor [Peptoniphilus duerdenii]
MGIRHLSGSPWHTEYASVEHEEDELRRDKRKCRYYSSINRCSYGQPYVCCGSNKCDVYSEKENINTKKQANSNKIENYNLKNYNEKRLKIGSKIKVKHLGFNKVLIFEIVNKNNENFIENKIRVDSPLAIAVAKAKVNEIIQVNERAKYKILEIIERK